MNLLALLLFTLGGAFVIANVVIVNRLIRSLIPIIKCPDGSGYHDWEPYGCGSMGSDYGLAGYTCRKCGSVWDDVTTLWKKRARR